MRYITHLGGATFTILISVVLLLFDDLRALGIATAGANALSHMAVQILKRTVVRARPIDTHGNLLSLVHVPDPYSFPSGHSAAAYAIGVPVALFHPVLAVPVLAMATLVAASRYTLKVHHFSDVVAGSSLGIAAGITIFLIGG